MKSTFWAISIQAAGSAATVGAALLVASQLGLSAQGEFGLLRSWGDALTSAAVLGLPQSLLHLQYREGVPTAALRGWALRYVFGLALLLVAAALVVVFGHLRPEALRLDDTTVLVLAVTVPLAALHLLCRSLLLRGSGAVRYGVITALPSLLIFVGLVPICVVGAQGGFVWALFASALVSAVVSAALVWRAPREAVADDAKTVWSRRTLWTIGIETGAQNVLTALSPALILSTASLLGAPLAQVGMVSLGLHAYQLFGVAAMYVAPLIYDRAARGDQTLTLTALFDRMRSRVNGRTLALLGLALVIATSLAARHWPQSAPPLWVLALMALAGLVSMAVRVLTTVMLARGAFRPLTIQAIGRLACVCAGTALLMQFWPVTAAVAVTLLVTELLMLAWLAGAMRQLGASSPAESVA